MDKKIKRIEKTIKMDAKKEGKAMGSLLKADRKQDAKMSAGDKMKRRRRAVFSFEPFAP